MVRSTCPVENCNYRSTGKTKEEVLLDLQRHSKKEHGADVNDISQNQPQRKAEWKED
jgi:predicted small metal-binding protein